MKITKEIVMELNNELAVMGCPFRYKYQKCVVQGNGNSQMEIILPSQSYVDSFSITPTKEFFNWLELWFKIKGIELSYNNTRSIIWSKNGWDENNK